MIDIIDWRITSKCNNSCLYCYASESLIELTDVQKYTIIDKIAPNCNAICITGGEPLLNTFEITCLLKYIYSKGIDIFLSTNGANFLENISDIIALYKKNLTSVGWIQ